VAKRLTLLVNALDELEQELAVQCPKLSPSTTTHQIHRFRNILAKSIENLGSPWGNVQPELTPDLMQCLGFWDELIAEAESAPDSQQLRDLLQAIVDARIAANQIADPPLRVAVLSILAQLESAILDYQVGGPNAFNRSFRQAVAELFEHEDLIRDNLQTEEVSKLRSVWEQFQQVCAPLIFTDSLLTAGSRLKEIGSTLLKLVQGGG
jgi:hypothetical protein